MKNLIFTFSLVCITLLSFNSCNTYTSLTSANSIKDLSGNPYVQNVAKSVIKNIANSLVQNGIKEASTKIGLNSSLASVLSTAQAVSGFKTMLSNVYGINSNTVNQQYAKFGMIKDVVAFVAKNANKGVNFYMN